LTPAVRPGRVLVVGAINVDLVVRAPHLPAPGETVVGPAVVRHGGGKGANAAVAAARAGAAVAFVGALGTDAAAADAERDLLAAGVDCDGVQRLDDQPTGMALIVVDPDGENQIAVGAGANHALDAGHVRACIDHAAGAIDCVLVCTEIPDAAVAAAVRAAAAAGIRCVLNPAPPIPAVLDVLDLGPLLTPNRGELDALARALAQRGGGEGDGGGDGGGGDGDGDGGGGDVAATPEDQARALGAVTGAPVCVTLGAGGVMVLHDGQVTRIVAATVDARDATGAGDTFNGVLAAWLAGGAAVGDAARAATTAASLSVVAIGARSGMPRREAIIEALAGRPSADGDD
jgi:ribokinase